MTSENTGEVEGEGNPLEISTVTPSSPFSTPRSGRKKKKGALAKLAEKKRRAEARLSDIESNYGSLISLQPELDEEVNGSAYDRDHVTVDKGGHSVPLSDGWRGLSNGQVSSAELISNSSSSKPVIKPRLSVSSNNHPSEEGLNSNRINSRTSATEISDPSATALQKLRAWKMTPSRSSSMESLKNSPFSPRPPTTPRKTPPESPKRDTTLNHRDAPSETMDADDIMTSVRSDKHRFLKNGAEFYSQELQDSGVEVLANQRPASHRYSKQSAALLADRQEPSGSETRDFTANGNTDTVEFVQSTNFPGTSTDNFSEFELQGVSNEYHKLLLKDTAEIESERASGLTTWGRPPSRTGRLTPLSPKHPPPALPVDYSSRVLRTANRTDSGYQMQKFLGRPTEEFRVRGEKGCDTAFHSEASTSVLPMITTKEAKARSYLLGSINSNSALLGAEELDRYFPDRKLHVFVGSWNMADRKECTTPLDDFILPDNSDYVQDLYVIGTQENSANKKEWEIRIQETLGPSHVLFHSATHGALHLAVFIRRDLIWFCSVPESDIVSTRAVTMVKTKGAVAISFTFFGTSFLFINSHFTSDDSRMKDRIVDYKKIIRELKLPKMSASSSPKSSTQVDITKKFDAVFWCGDLNFRISRKRDHVEDMLEFGTSQVYPNYEKLIASDQLTNCINDGQIFLGFQEGRISFQPTYKFDINSEKYDTSNKLRIPSYTDRVLFRSKKKNSISCVLYDAAMSIKASDHRPVFGLFETALRPGRDTIPLAAGQFDRPVYVEANRRRALHRAVQKKSSAICSLQ